MVDLRGIKRGSAPNIGLASRLINWAVFKYPKTWKKTIPPTSPPKKTKF